MGEPEKYCALFQRSPIWDYLGQSPDRLHYAANHELNVGIGELRICDQQQAVFVDVVEFRQHPKRVTEWVRWPSPIRLQRLDCCLSSGTNMLDPLIDNASDCPACHR